MPLVSRILQEYSKERGVSDVGRPSSYVSDKDTLILEDESARIPIVCEGSLLVSKFVSGMIVAFRGRSNKDGDFLASDVCYADVPPQATRNLIHRITLQSFLELKSEIQIRIH